jgi:hypothetical protein
MMYLKLVSHTDDRVRILEADDVQYRWLTKEDKKAMPVSSRAVFCFHDDPSVDFDPNVEFFLFRDGDPRQVLMDIGRTAYIMNENGKTIDTVN